MWDVLKSVGKGPLTSGACERTHVHTLLTLSNSVYYSVSVKVRCFLNMNFTNVKLNFHYPIPNVKTRGIIALRKRTFHVISPWLNNTRDVCLISPLYVADNNVAVVHVVTKYYLHSYVWTTETRSFQHSRRWLVARTRLKVLLFLRCSYVVPTFTSVCINV